MKYHRLLCYLLLTSSYTLLSQSIKFTLDRLQSIPSKIKSKFFDNPPDILQIVSYIDHSIQRFKNLPTFDFTAGAVGLSSPDDLSHRLYNSSIIAPVSSRTVTDLDQHRFVRPSPVLRLHQIGKKLVRKLPDNALLGTLVIIASELLQRELLSKTSVIPPLLQTFANTTILELDTKLETLSQLQWDFDPFIQAELERLQTQPLEAIDRFLVVEVLPKVDKELSPILAKLTTDPAKVKVITNNIKDVIQLTTFLILKPNKYAAKSSLIQDSIFESVDLVGKGIEDVIKEWNRAIEELGKVVKTESVVKLLPQTFFTNKEYTSKSITQWFNSIRKSKRNYPTLPYKRNSPRSNPRSSSSSSNSSNSNDSWYSKYMVQNDHTISNSFFNLTETNETSPFNQFIKVMNVSSLNYGKIILSNKLKLS